MYTVNISPVRGLYIRIASGNPFLRKGEGNSIEFFSTSYFVLHLCKDGETTPLGILTPGRQP
jgi:hypothetical protein